MACCLPLAAWVHVFRRERRVASDSREIPNFAGVDLNGTASQTSQGGFTRTYIDTHARTDADKTPTVPSQLSGKRRAWL